MELVGCQRSFIHINESGVEVSSFTSDRHQGIAKWLREKVPGTAHYHDIWHVGKA